MGTIGPLPTQRKKQRGKVTDLLKGTQSWDWNPGGAATAAVFLGFVAGPLKKQKISRSWGMPLRSQATRGTANWSSIHSSIQHPPRTSTQAVFGMQTSTRQALPTGMGETDNHTNTYELVREEK